MATLTITQSDDPVVIHTRLFKGDDGWYYELRIWKGDVDTSTASPTIIQPKKPYKAKRTAAAVLVQEVAKALRVQIF